MLHGLQQYRLSAVIGEKSLERDAEAPGKRYESFDIRGRVAIHFPIGTLQNALYGCFANAGSLSEG